MFEGMLYGGSVLAAVCLMFSVYFFIKNDVAKLVGDVTGWNARRAIKKINKKGAESASKTEAIQTEISQVLIRSAGTTGTLKTVRNMSETPAKEKKEKKSRRRWLERRKEEKTDILLEDSGLEEPAKAIFQPEEDMVVLAGHEIAGTKQEREEAQQSIFETGTGRLGQETESVMLMEDETSVLDLESEATSLLTEDEATDLLQEGESTVLLSDEATALLSEEATGVLHYEGEETDVLAAGEEATDILADGEVTMVLEQEETTSLSIGETTTLLYGEESAYVSEREELTDVLTEDDSTEILAQEETTSLLAAESTDVLYGDEETDILLSEGHNGIMKEATTILAGEEMPMPAIFDVEEEATVVHTEESIGTPPEEI